MTTAAEIGQLIVKIYLFGNRAREIITKRYRCYVS